jgi:aspartate kinase
LNTLGHASHTQHSVNQAQKTKVPIRLLNTTKPEAQGTIISEQSSGHDFTAFAAKVGITVINIQAGRMLLAYGFLSSVFEVFERYLSPIDMMTTSEMAVLLTIDKNDHIESILADLLLFSTTEVELNQTIICIVGDFRPRPQKLAFRMLEALGSVPLRLISYGGS